MEYLFSVYFDENIWELLVTIDPICYNFFIGDIVIKLQKSLKSGCESANCFLYRFKIKITMVWIYKFRKSRNQVCPTERRIFLALPQSNNSIYIARENTHVKSCLQEINTINNPEV